jgi:hypothetical protein
MAVAVTAHPQPEDGRNALVVTASNTAAKQLLVYDSSGKLLQTVPTQGQGGVSGNAGGIATSAGTVAVVNFASESVSVFANDGNGFEVKQLIPTASSPGQRSVRQPSSLRVGNHEGGIAPDLRIKYFFQPGWIRRPVQGGWFLGAGWCRTETACNHREEQRD